MFKSGRWRSDKNKIKAVFKLQFQATQVPKSKKSTLTISLVPDDVGKPTVKLEKAAVQDGICSWENPVYEMVKLIRESKTGKLKEKIYHFIVSAGSSKAGFLGEASIDFADFAAEIEPYTLSLPLKFANSGAVLHVTIQKVEGSDQREIEDEPPLFYNEGSRKNQLSILSAEDEDQHTYFEDGYLDESMPPLVSYPEPHAVELETENRSIPQEPPIRQSSMPPRESAASAAASNNKHRRSITEWSLGSASDGSLTDSVNNADEQLRRERFHKEASDATIEKLRSEIDSLTRQSTLSELELQSLRKQIVKETKRGQSLSTQISSLKEEKDALQMECEQLRSCWIHTKEAETPGKLQLEYEETKAQLQAIRQELDHEKDSNVNLRLQLHKTQDSNSELLLAVRDLDEMLKEKNAEMSYLTSKINENLEESRKSNGWPERCMKRNDAIQVDLLERKIEDQHDEIELYKKQNEELEAHLEQLTLDYEILKQENHDITTQLEEQNLQEEMNEQVERSESSVHIRELEVQIEKLELVVKRQAQELSESLISINELESQVKHLEKEIDKQAKGFEEDLEAMTQVKIELEQRAIRAEEALRKTRLKNALTAERLQEDFRRLSVEMTSKFDENEKLAVKALDEANELRQQKEILEEMLQKANEELRLRNDQNEVNVQELCTQLALRATEMEHIKMELNNKSELLEYMQNDDKQKHEASSKEIETLKSEIEGLRKEKDDIKELEEQKAKLRAEGEQAEVEMFIQRWNEERESLAKKFASEKKDAEVALKELGAERSSKKEKEEMIACMQSKMENLTAQQQNLKHILQKEQKEKEGLTKRLLQLQRELTRREEEITKENGAFTCNCGQAAFVDRNTTTCDYQSTALCIPEMLAILREKFASLKNQIEHEDRGAEKPAWLGDAQNLRNIIEELCKTIEQLEDVKHAGRSSRSHRKSGERNETVDKSQHINGKPMVQSEDNCNDLRAELTVLSERNKLMEQQLKEMEERYSEISLRFAEVEGERQQLVMTIRNLKNSRKH
ncbi:interaptin [Rhodamnia argentea]|uniref:Interaptin n=1 Tax=Rhodamnia argentea TaxID=178133 RepID=A0ABM3HZI0_9MYRT|nr:interaptin [Rhodamnia argentea]